MGIIAQGLAAGASLIGGAIQGRQARKLATHQNKLNKSFLDYQNAYNTPAQQMKRFEEAGLNKHLIYGQGSPGNQSSPQQAEKVELPDWSVLLAQSVQNLNQTIMQQNQTAATQAGIGKTIAQTETEKIKAAVFARNPLLNDTAFSAAIDKMVSDAQRSGAGLQRDIYGAQIDVQNLTAAERKNRLGEQFDQKKIESELNLLFQRFKLNEADQAIKAEILSSKQFLNELQRMEVEFIKAGDMNYGHMMTFIKLLLSKI